MIINDLQITQKDNKYIVSDGERSFGVFIDTLETDSYWFCSVEQLQQIKQFIETEKQLIDELNKDATSSV